MWERGGGERKERKGVRMGKVSERDRVERKGEGGIYIVTGREGGMDNG